MPHVTRPTSRRPERPPGLIWVTVAALTFIAAACGATADEDAAATTTTESTTTSESSTTTVDSTTTTTPDDDVGLGEIARCTNPNGFSISYPVDWQVNDGSVTSACSQFDPEPFTVPEASDARVAVITAFVDAVPFADVAASAPGPEQLRAVTTVDGHQAVRVSGPSDDDGLYPAGTAETSYLIDLSLGTDDGPGTLFIDVVDVGDVDFETASRTLDLMVRTIDLEGDGIESADPATVARYEGGGTPIAVLAEVDTAADGVCLRLDVSEATSCVGEVGTDSPVRTARLGDDLQPVLAGTASAEVFRIEARQDDGSPSSFLPVAIDTPTEAAAEAAVRGWAFPFGRGEVTELVWYDLAGEELGSRTIESSDDEGPDPIGSFGDGPITSDGFPATGSASFLTDVRVAGNDGFDRVVFQLTDDGDELSYEISFTDEAVQQPSGQPLDIDGDRFVEVTMVPASGVDLSGDTPDVRYDGPHRFTPDTTATVQSVAVSEDWESTMVWLIGVDDDAQVAASVLQDPRRLVVDVTGGAGAG